jgi:hypothetical protein
MVTQDAEREIHVIVYYEADVEGRRITRMTFGVRVPGAQSPCRYVVRCDMESHLGVSRCNWFDTIERPAMQALPGQAYEYAEWKLARVGIDYHVEVASFLFGASSTPTTTVDTRLTERTVEIFGRGKRIAAHVQRYSCPRCVTWLRNRPHPEQGFRKGLGILQLFRTLDAQRSGNHRWMVAHVPT